ncbi:MAG: cytochrome P460 family protein [Polyangiaceae bacterium]
MNRRSTPSPLAMALSTSLLLAGAGGCEKSTQRALPAHEPFIALERDFQGFQSWTKVNLADRPALGAAHAAGDAHEYINQLPPAGSHTFPVGTILVKTMKSERRATDAGVGGAAAGGGTDVFAMVKRGAGYNAKGTPGWEWFELRPRSDDTLGIVWRGINPPDGEGYGRDVTGGCNSCHQQAVKNDYVQALSLAGT